MTHAHAARRHLRPARRLCELQCAGAAARARTVGCDAARRAGAGRGPRRRTRHRAHHAPRPHRERLAARGAREAGRRPAGDGRLRTSARERRRRGDPTARRQRRGCGGRGRVRAGRRRARGREHRRRRVHADPRPGRAGARPRLPRTRPARFSASRAQFLRNGEAPPAGTRFVQAELAHTLELIADSGPKVFYRGRIAELLVREMERGGGLITRDDLARYRAKWRAPLQIDYRGYTIYTMPPPSGGGVTLAEILNTMEGFGSLPAFGSARLLHLQAEAMRRAYADRNAFLGDPDFVALPLKR